jgi:polyphosphate kinase
MPRNLDRRVEIMFPVESPELVARIKGILQTELDDNVKASVLQADGTYAKPDRRGKASVLSQEVFCEEAERLARKEEEQADIARAFTPKMHPND